MKKIIFLFLTIVFCSFCTSKESIVINIQPLDKVSNEHIAQVKKSVKTFYGYDCKVLPSKKITNDMLSKVTKRIDANKAISVNKTNTNLLYITEKDICYFKDKSRPEYGIFGLGAINGKTCIISTFRLRRGVNIRTS